MMEAVAERVEGLTYNRSRVAAVEIISEQGMSGKLAVYPDLVCPPGG